MIPDIEIKHYYKKYLTDANDDIKKFQEEYELAKYIKEDSYEVITEKFINVLKSVGINLTDYKQEWIIGQYNESKTLLNIAYNKLEYFQDGQERIALLHIIKYCNMLDKCRKLYREIELAKQRSNLGFAEYRKIVANYYQYGVQKCCIEGYAYHYGYGIGDLLINRWKFDAKDKVKRKFVDYKATAAAKKKLIAEGKTPYSKKMAEIYKFRGIKYDGVPYVVYQQQTAFYDIDVINSRYISRSNINFEHHETINKSIRGKTQEEIAAECDNKEVIFKLPCDIRFKLMVYNYFDTTAYLKYIRNVEQCKYKRGAHNSQNRQRF